MKRVGILITLLAFSLVSVAQESKNEHIYHTFTVTSHSTDTFETEDSKGKIVFVDYVTEMEIHDSNSVYAGCGNLVLQVRKRLYDNRVMTVNLWYSKCTYVMPFLCNQCFITTEDKTLYAVATRNAIRVKQRGNYYTLERNVIYATNDTWIHEYKLQTQKTTKK